MKKTQKTLIAIVLIVITTLTSITAFASNEEPSPRLSHTEDGHFTFAATENGGYCETTYYGYDSFVRADLTIKVQKRFLLVFWNDVGEWQASSTEKDGYFFHAFALNGSGMYRATFTLTITGNNGTVDTIEQVIESKY